MAGTVTYACFDKTGTLTKNGIEFYSVTDKNEKEYSETTNIYEQN